MRKVKKRNNIPNFVNKKQVIKASNNNFSRMINKSDDIKVIKKERNSNTRNFFFIINGINPICGKKVKIKREGELKKANNINNIRMNIKGRSKPINGRIVVRKKIVLVIKAERNRF